MWTAKRIMMLMGGLLLALSNYAVYALFLGGIDGLAPLPTEYWRAEGPQAPVDESLLQGEADRKLEAAFGAGRDELKRPLKLWLPEKGMALAAGEFFIDPKDGRVRLAPFSVAIFHKGGAPDAFPEISTIKCDVAYLTLDRGVTQYSELNGKKVIAIEMRGKQPTGITLSNNRRTPEKGDDVDIFVTDGHLFWEERRNLIWTDGVVRLLDGQSSPPTEISGKGMDMLLARESSPNRPKAAGPKARAAGAHNDSNNIEKIILRAHVDMRFWVDASSGFLGGTPNKKNPQPVPGEGPKEKAQIHITTPGKFVYDLPKEYAWFESPPPHEDVIPLHPEQVLVTRSQKINKAEITDELTCHRLDLQFRRKPGGADAAGLNLGGDKEILTAKAIRHGVTDVVLTLNSEGMGAYGSEMNYKAGDVLNGPLTILKGEPGRPLRTYKQGHTLNCDELHLFAANRQGEGERAWARGPGEIALLDNKGLDKKNVRPTRILWNDTLTVVKEKEGGQLFDLMTVKGNASFIDEQQKQELHGETIMVWLLNLQDSANKPQASGGSRQELHRVFAQDNVRARTAEFLIRRTNRLTMSFLPEVARSARLPGSNEIVNVVNSPDERRGAFDNTPAVVIPTPGIQPLQIQPPAEPKKPAPPIELEANEVTMAIATLGPKKQLQDLIAKGNVLVYQPGDKPGEKRLDIRGQLLTVKQTGVDTHTMIVHAGDAKTPAQLEVGDTILWGPLITIDQLKNLVDVDGGGAMQMPSNKNLDGTELAKGQNSPRITIYWAKNMTFNGQYAYFYGNVQAEQTGSYSKLKCEELAVKLDKLVSFKEGQKSNQNAKIERTVCDRNVYIDDIQVDDKKQLVQRNILRGSGLNNRDDGGTTLSGPGSVRTLAMGDADAAMAPGQGAPQAKAGPKKLAWKQTRVDFRDQMFSNTKAATKNAKFYGANAGIEVYHFPTIKIDADMNPNSPPKDGFYLQCDYLEVTGQQLGNKTTQLMIAQGRNVYFRSDLYIVTANIITYNEQTDIVTFEATDGNVVRMSKIVDGKVQPASVINTKVLYNRRTNEMTIENLKSLQN